MAEIQRRIFSLNFLFSPNLFTRGRDGAPSLAMFSAISINLRLVIPPPPHRSFVKAPCERLTIQLEDLADPRRPMLSLEPAAIVCDNA